MRNLLLQGAWLCALVFAAWEIRGILYRAGQYRLVIRHLAVLVGFSAVWLLLSYAVPLWVHTDSLHHLLTEESTFKGPSSRALLKLILGSISAPEWQIVLLFRTQILLVPVIAYALALLLVSSPQPQDGASSESAPLSSTEGGHRAAFWASLFLVAQPQWFLPHLNVSYFSLYGACVALVLLGAHGLSTRQSASAAALLFSALVLLGCMRPEGVVVALGALLMAVVVAFRRRRLVIACVGLVVGVLLLWYAVDAVRYIMHQARTEPLSLGTTQRHDLGGQPWYRLILAWAENMLLFLPRNLLFLAFFQHVILVGAVLGGARLVRERRVSLPVLIALWVPCFYLTLVLGKDIGFQEPVKYHALSLVPLWALCVGYAHACWARQRVRVMTYFGVAMTLFFFIIPFFQR